MRAGRPDGSGTEVTVAPLVTLSSVPLLVASSGSVKVGEDVGVDEIDENSNELWVRKENWEASDVGVVIARVVVIRLEDVLAAVVASVVLPVGNVIDVSLVPVAVDESFVNVEVISDVKVPLVSDGEITDVVLFVSWPVGEEVVIAIDVLLSPDWVALVVSGGADVIVESPLLIPLVIEQRIPEQVEDSVLVETEPASDVCVAEVPGSEMPSEVDEGAAESDVVIDDSVVDGERMLQRRPVQEDDDSVVDGPELSVEVADSCEVDDGKMPQRRPEHVDELAVTDSLLLLVSDVGAGATLVVPASLV